MLTDFPLTDLEVHLIGIIVLPLLGYFVGRAHGGVIFQNAIVRLSARLLTDERGER
jgi:hypothetical protein